MSTPRAFDMWTYVPNCPDPASDPSEWNDTQCVAAVQAARVERLNTHGMTLPKLVRQLNRVGFSLLLSDYKNLEREPYKNLATVRRGVIQAVYKVLQGDVPPSNINMDEGTLSVMDTIRSWRESQAMTCAEMAAELSAKGDRISEREYQAIENGVTRHATVSFVLRVAEVLNVRPEDFFS